MVAVAVAVSARVSGPLRRVPLRHSAFTRAREDAGSCKVKLQPLMAEACASSMSSLIGSGDSVFNPSTKAAAPDASRHNFMAESLEPSGPLDATIGTGEPSEEPSKPSDSSHLSCPSHISNSSHLSHPSRPCDSSHPSHLSDSSHLSHLSRPSDSSVPNAPSGPPPHVLDPGEASAFEMHLGVDRWRCVSGRSTLRQYLSLDSHCNITTMPAPQLSDWLLALVDRQRSNSKLFRQREKIRDLLALHSKEIKTLEENLSDARRAYESLDCFNRFTELDASSKKLDLAIQGITTFLAESSGLISSSIQGSADEHHLLQEKRKKKVQSAILKLAEAQNDQSQIRTELEMLSSERPEREEYFAAEAALERFLREIGVYDEEQVAKTLQVEQGEGTSTRGMDFESIATHAIAAAFGVPQVDAIAASDSVAAVLQSKEGKGEGKQSRAVLADLVEPTGSDTLLCILSNVTLGMASAEIDKMVVKLSPQTGAKISRKVQTSEISGISGSSEEVGNSGDTNFVSPRDLEGAFDVVEVVALVECKRNSNDLAFSFFHYQKTIAWLAGDREGYNASEMRTNFHRSGHFEKPTVHCEGKAEFTFCPGSFNKFKKHPRLNLYLERLVLITFMGKSGSLNGVDSRAISKLIYRLSTTKRLNLNVGESHDMESILKLQNWIAAQCLAPKSTSDILSYYLDSDLLSRHILLLSQREAVA